MSNKEYQDIKRLNKPILDEIKEVLKNAKAIAEFRKKRDKFVMLDEFLCHFRNDKKYVKKQGELLI